jgi:ribosomal peptide maturation radical SAM protein 1
MKKGRVHAIQPGIESFSDKILKIMKKGVSGLQNIALLKMCRELEIISYWNMLWGFPGEPVEEYTKMERFIPLLLHLQPPEGISKIMLDRFSPYFIDPEQNGLTNVIPLKVYEFIYPLPEKDLFNIAYHFDFEYKDSRNPELYVERFEQSVRNWVEAWENDIPILNIVYLKDTTIIIDTRPCSLETLQMLSIEESKVYRLCDTIQSLQTIYFSLQTNDPSLTQMRIKEILSDLMHRNLMIEDGGKYLSLAVQVKEEWLKNRLRILTTFENGKKIESVKVVS